MCGRYAQTKKAREQARLLALRREAAAPRPETWNLAPSTESLIVCADDNGLVEDWFRWGFERRENSGLRPINARVEGVSSKWTFEEAWRTRRCVVPADGWFEWRKQRDGRQPFYFHRSDGEPLFFAGLASPLNTFAILTMAADGGLEVIHHRRPIVLTMDRAKEWVETVPESEDRLMELAVRGGNFSVRPVGPAVGNIRNDGPELIEEKEVLRPPQGDLFENPA